MRGPLRATIACSAALAATACGASTTSRHGLVGRPQAATLRLAAGASTKSFNITALPPPRYVWDARVTAPAEAGISVRIRTWYGVELGVLDPHQRDFCRIRASRSVCFMPFPLLEAQRAGRWTVIAAKRSGPAASVRISITFHKP